MKNQPLQRCSYCGAILVRVHDQGDVYCNNCSESLLKRVDSWSGKTYVKCPTCGYEGMELVDPKYETRCPKCNNFVLHQ